MRFCRPDLPATALSLLTLASCSWADSFDYVVVGAGTSGLVIANRLSQNPHVTVAVIDPGPDERDNPAVRNPAIWPVLLQTPVNWAYQTVPQANASNRVIEFDAGRGIGGTSLINGTRSNVAIRNTARSILTGCVVGMTYIRGDKAQFDAWERLGNTGWNWDILLHHYKKVERLFAPSPWQAEVGASAQRQFHGDTGEVRVGFTPALQNGSFYDDCKASWEKLGQAVNDDVNSGTTRGFDVWPQTLDPEQNLRWDAARAFFWPVAGRKNLHLLNGTASRILWRSDVRDHAQARVSGVEYLASPDGKRTTVKIDKEVILSAGALRTPLILERSGVGNPAFLKAKGIKSVVDLPGVGENLIDQPNISLAYASKPNRTGTSPYATFVTARDLFGNETGHVAARTRRQLRQWAETTARLSDSSLNASALEHIFQIQHELIFDKGVTIAEILTTAAQNAALSIFWPLLPFSRGSVHVRSKDDEHVADPVIDPRYLFNGFDTTTYVAAGRLSTAFWRQEPISDTISGRLLPNLTTLPDDATDDQWKRWLEDSIGSNSHSIGTAAMMPRSLGGVVDTALRVYGTKGVRVVDASILPMQFSGHLTATLYAVADRAADIIQGAAN